MKEERLQLWVIVLIVFMGFVGTSIAYPIFPPLFLHETTSIIPATWNVHSKSILLGVALAAYPLGQFIGAAILGSCSDRYGRKRVLMISLFGSVIGYFLTALSLSWNVLSVLLASRFLTGMVEGNAGIVRAFAADLPLSKYKSIGRMNIAASLGYVLGPLLGGFLSDHHLFSWFSFAFPFYLAAFFSMIALFLAASRLKEKKPEKMFEVSLLERFNFVRRLKKLTQQNKLLKYLFIVSTIFTFSVDIFYEFGPVYLTGLWSFTSAQIALYNAMLCVALALGSVALPPLLRYFTTERLVVISMGVVALTFGLLVIFPNNILAFLLFGLVGFIIPSVNTCLVVQVSDAADKTIQGEALGAQVSLRMLGDGLICLLGGFLIISSVMWPIALSCVIALTAMILYWVRFRGRA